MRAEKLWNNLAKNWDKPGVSLGETDLKVLAKTRPYLKAGSVVLDYGCATGSIAFELAKSAKTVYGVDISYKMIEIAKGKAVKNKAENVNFVCGSIFNEGLKKGTFDVITAFSILHLVPDIPQVLERINTLLKPGGVFITLTPCLGQKKLSVLLMEIPVWAASKTGILPKVNFFSTLKLTGAVTAANLKIIETEKLKDTSLIEYFMVGKKG
jgi:2-polyprenyl-3-methyl-5-hydroxy-6-metoxy-1,4-benzoquinol methylase